MTKITLWLILFILLSGIPAYTQSLPAEENSSEPGDFWISASVETIMFKPVSAGAGLAFGYGKGASVGIKAVFYPEQESAAFLELTFLLRFYLMGTAAYSGPFLQLSGGPTLIGINGDLAFPSELGVISAGVHFGWRFLFKDRWFVEPCIRGGYPYMFGAGVSGGIRF